MEGVKGVGAGGPEGNISNAELLKIISMFSVTQFSGEMY